MLGHVFELLLLSVERVGRNRGHRDISNVLLGNVVEPLLLLKQHLLLLLGGCVGDRVVVSFWIFTSASLQWVASSTGIVDVEELAQLLLAFLVLLARKDCLARGVCCLLRDDLDIQCTLGVVRAKQRADADVVQARLLVWLAV